VANYPTGWTAVPLYSPSMLSRPSSRNDGDRIRRCRGFHKQRCFYSGRLSASTLAPIIDDELISIPRRHGTAFTDASSAHRHDCRPHAKRRPR